MLRMLRWLTVPAIVVGMLFVTDIPKANAGSPFQITIGGFGGPSIVAGNPYFSGRPSFQGGGFHSRHGYDVQGGYGVQGGYSYRGGYSSYRSSYGNGYRSSYGHGGYHVQPHYDYHGPSLVPHRGHFDYVPGHFDRHYGCHR